MEDDEIDIESILSGFKEDSAQEFEEGGFFALADEDEEEPLFRDDAFVAFDDFVKKESKEKEKKEYTQSDKFEIKFLKTIRSIASKYDLEIRHAEAKAKLENIQRVIPDFIMLNTNMLALLFFHDHFQKRTDRSLFEEAEDLGIDSSDVVRYYTFLKKRKLISFDIP